MKMAGMIFDIQRLSIHDGPGIRTTVFLKGCPLHCAWCHNLESKSIKSEIGFYEKRCAHCGNCVNDCPNLCHELADFTHKYIRERCTSCGLCTGHCYTKALEVIGTEMDVTEVMKEVLTDRAFYENSGGGMTLSGGEPMYQPKFAIELAKAAKKERIHVCLETSGFCKQQELLEIAKYVDLFLYDYKVTGKRHKEYIGVSQKFILSNLIALDDADSKMVLRCPMIPGININNEHIDGIIHTSLRLKNIVGIDLEPYHPMGASKCIALGKKVTFQNHSFLQKSELTSIAKIIQEKTGITVNIL